MLRTMIAALTLAVISSARGEPSEAPPTAKPLLDAYEVCVVGHAKSLAGSPDSEEAIVRSAIRSCAAQQHALSEALRAAGVASDQMTMLVGKLDRQVGQAGSRAVVEERDAH